MVEADTMITVFILLLGSGLFLRLVAKEKHRREKYLLLRLHEKAEELKKEAEAKAGGESGEEEDEETEDSHTVAPVEVSPPE